MRYARPAYGDPALKVIKKPGFFGMKGFDVPVPPDYPIPIRENFRRAAFRDHPAWVPNSMTGCRRRTGPGGTATTGPTGSA